MSSHPFRSHLKLGTGSICDLTELSILPDLSNASSVLMSCVPVDPLSGNIWFDPARLCSPLANSRAGRRALSTFDIVVAAGAAGRALEL